MKKTFNPAEYRKSVRILAYLDTADYKKKLLKFAEKNQLTQSKAAAVILQNYLDTLPD